MCFEALVNGGAAEKPLSDLVRDEMSSAVKDGAAAALVVLALVVAGGASPALVAGVVLGTAVLGVVVHQFVLVAGVAVVRAWATDERPAIGPARQRTGSR